MGIRLVAIMSVLLAFGTSGCKMIRGGAPASPDQQPFSKPWERKHPVSQPSQAPSLSPQTKKSIDQIPENPIRGWEKLLETDLYELYAKDFRVDWCLEKEPWLKQVFKVGADFVIVNDDAYSERFEREILPIVKAQCGQLTTVRIYHYIKGVRIDHPSLKESTEIPGNKGSLPDWSFTGVSLSQASIKGDAQGNLTYIVGGYESLLDLRAQREPQRQTTAEDQESEEQKRKRAEETADVTSDGKLNLAGIETEHRRLFLRIYNRKFVELAIQDNAYYPPYLMYSGLIQQYDDLCHDSLSKNRVKVDIYETRYLYSSYNWFQTTRYYERYLAKTVYMEPRYKAAYLSSVDTYLKKLMQGWKERRDENFLLYYVTSSEEGIQLAISSRKLIAVNRCGSPAIIRFIDNLHQYVTDAWDAKLPDGSYDYAERGSLHTIERFYLKVPRSFNPDFPVPTTHKAVAIWLNKGDASVGLNLIQVDTFSLRDLTPDRTYTSIKLPSAVRQALKEKKYSIAECTYLVGPAAAKRFFYWNANGPLPPESVQAFAKKNIFEPRTSCPVSMPSRN